MPVAVTALSFALLAACTQAPPPPREGPPDVFLIVVDTLRADHLGIYGYAEPTSPAIDRLARDALVFDRAYSTAPWTLASISTILSGHFASAVGVRRGGSLDADVPILTSLYKDRGYAAGAVVSHLFLREKFGLIRGMDEVDEHEIAKNPHMHISSPEVTRRALAMLDDHLDDDPDQPMFMLVHYFDVHYNYFAHPDVYDPDPGYAGPVESGMPYLKLRKLVQAGTGGEQSITRIRQLYDSEIRFTDGYIGQFVDGLRTRNRFDNAMVVLVADHGEELGDRPDKWVGHTHPMSEDTLHVPLIMKLPEGRRAGQRIPWPVSLVDLMPTVADLTGVRPPAMSGLNGQVLDLDDADANRATFFAETHRSTDRQMVLHGDWKLRRRIKAATKKKPVEITDRLYNLATDPGERVDRAADRPDVLADLAARLDAFDKAVALDAATVQGGGSVADTPPLSKDEEAALRAMGYIE